MIEPKTFLVFAQRADVELDVDALSRHAKRFFDATLNLEAPGRVAVASKSGIRGTRAIVGRPTTAEDLALAETIEAGKGGGLSLLASRCRTVWLIDCEEHRDRAALLLATIVAAVDLGPILTPERDAILGVKSARALLDAS